MTRPGRWFVVYVNADGSIKGEWQIDISPVGPGDQHWETVLDLGNFMALRWRATTLKPYNVFAMFVHEDLVE